MARLVAILALAFSARAALMPFPARLAHGRGQLTIDAGFHVENSGCPSAAVARFQSRLELQTGVRFAGGGPALTIVCRAPGASYPALGDDESYSLVVSPAGARIDAPLAVGALRGFETFAQWLNGREAAAVRIEDRPRYPWRGLMIDVARHFMPPDVIKRNLDAMAAVKLNVLHWHLSDDQGFRVESRLFPRLAQFGSDGQFYTQEQVREIVDYARDRGIRVVPEFDMPGHTTSWFVGMPELASDPGPYQIERRYGVFPWSMAMDREPTYTFLDALIGEMAGLFPDRNFHIGGDEVEVAQKRALQPGFNQRVQAILAGHGKSMVGWEEILAPGLAADAVVQAWRGPDTLAAIARQGNRGILSYGYYLNYLDPASSLYAVDPGDGPGVLGGEACMWAEYVDAQTVDSRIWPRMAAVAERFWSPRGIADPSWMYARLDEVSRWLEWTGIRHRTGPSAMIAALAGANPVEPLRTLAEASEAGGHSVRGQAGGYTTLTPLNRFVDAVTPESELVRRLETAVAQRDWDTLRQQFLRWTGNPAPSIGEIVPLALNLNAVGQIGLDALDYIESGRPAPTDWVAQQNRVLDSKSGPVAETILAAVRPVKALVALAAR